MKDYGFIAETTRLFDLERSVGRARRESARFRGLRAPKGVAIALVWLAVAVFVAGLAPHG